MGSARNSDAQLKAAFQKLWLEGSNHDLTNDFAEDLVVFVKQVLVAGRRRDAPLDLNLQSGWFS